MPKLLVTYGTQKSMPNSLGQVPGGFVWLMGIEINLFQLSPIKGEGGHLSTYVGVQEYKTPIRATWHSKWFFLGKSHRP